MKIHHIAITANSLEESKRFYQNLFCFEVSKEFERKDMGAKAIFLELNGLFLELWEFVDIKGNADDLNDIKIKGIRHIAFEVDNLTEILKNFKQQGIEFREPKLGASGHMYSFISDPNGVALEIYQK